MERRPFKTMDEWFKTFIETGVLTLPDPDSAEALVHFGSLSKPQFDAELLDDRTGNLRMAAVDLVIAGLNAGYDLLSATKVIGNSPVVRLVAENIDFLKKRKTTPLEKRGDCKPLDSNTIHEICANDVVLVVESGFTDGQLVRLVNRTADEVGAIVLPCTLALFDHSRGHVPHVHVVSLTPHAYNL